MAEKETAEVPVTLSACMIVKDEQDFLPQCLGSVVDFVDEIVVVDTGSTDMTKDIALAFGARVYDHPWQNDFSLHRNQAFGHAAGEWLLVIDADEELARPAVSGEELRRRFEMIPPDIGALVVNVREINRKTRKTDFAWLSMRFFRSSANPRYTGYIHNESKVDGKQGMTDFTIFHYGYSLSPEKMAKKHERTGSLLLRRLEEAPEDYKAMYYLAHTLAAQSKFTEALDLCKKCLSLVPVDDPGKLQFYGNLYFVMGQIFLKLNDGSGAMACANKGLEFYPDDIDLNWLKASVCYQAGLDDDFWKHANKYVELLPIYREALQGKLGGKSVKTAADLPEAIRSNRTITTISSSYASVIAKQMAHLTAKEGGSVDMENSVS